MDRAQKGLRVFTGRISDTTGAPSPTLGTSQPSSSRPACHHLLSMISPRCKIHGFLFPTTRIWAPLFGKQQRKWKLDQRGAWGERKGADPWPQSPDHTFAVPHSLPVVPTPSSPAPHLVQCSPNPDRLCPKAHLLERLAAFIAPTIPMAISLGLSSLGHVSPAVSNWGRAHASCLSGSFQRTQQQGMSPHCPHLPLSPPPTGVSRPIHLHRLFPHPCMPFLPHLCLSKSCPCLPGGLA